jgi:hypothetical protein
MGKTARTAIIAGTLVMTLGVFVTQASAASKTAYNSIPSVLPGNVPSVGFEATAASEFGDLVGIVAHHGGAKLAKMNVVMSSWGCKGGTWNGDNCATPPGATFSVPITANVYAVDNSGPLPEPGALLASKTKTFKIKYRPAADNIDCTGAQQGEWYSVSEATCYNGFAQTITFNFTGGVHLPGQVIWTVAYNTTHYGYTPIGESAACYMSSGGCGYDSLNVGVETFPGQPGVGTDIDPGGVVWNTSVGAQYCDGGAGGSGTLRDDTGCPAGPTSWVGYTPLAKIITM